MDDMDSQTDSVEISALGAAPADIAVPEASATSIVSPSSEPVLQGLPFDVDAMKSTFKITNPCTNVYEVCFKEMEDVNPAMIEGITEGLVRRIVLPMNFCH